MKHILALVIILPFLFAGCQKSETIKADKSSETGVYKTIPEYCGNPITLNLYEYGYGFDAGQVIIGNDDNGMLHVTMETNDPGITFVKTHLYVGPESGIPGINIANGEGQFYLGSPEFLLHEFTPPYPSQDYFMVDISGEQDCFSIVVHAKVRLENGSVTDVFGTFPLKTWGYYIEYCKQECETECETAYAYGGEGIATCFLDIQGVNSNNWGWSNGPISDPSSYSWDIYAGAGQCDINKGTWVGTLDVDYSAGTVIVTYNIDPDFTLDETHLFIGENGEMLPRKTGEYTTAPGQFPYSGQSSYTIDGLSGDIYVVAHSVVCGDYDE